MQPFPPEKIVALKKDLDEAIRRAKRPIAAVDADGTLWDTDLGEAFFDYQIRNSLLKGLPADPWRHYEDLKVKVSHEVAYVWLAQILKGIPITQVREWAHQCVQAQSPLPIHQAVREVIDHLHSRGCEVYIVTASIKWAVEPGAQAFGIPPDRVIGITTKIEDGRVTDQQDGVITYRAGKVDGLLKATGGVAPLFCAGNTEGDLPLLESSTGVRLVIAGSGKDNSNYATERRMIDLAKSRQWYYHSYL